MQKCIPTAEEIEVIVDDPALGLDPVIFESFSSLVVHPGTGHWPLAAGVASEFD